MTQKQTRDIILRILSRKNSMSADKLVRILFKKYRISERETKEAIWHLLEYREIMPDKYWKLTRALNIISQ